MATALATAFIPITKKDKAKECSNYHTIALISYAIKVMLKILQPRLQQYMNWEIPDLQVGFRKGRGTRGQIPNIRWITEKAREFQKKSTSASLSALKLFDCVDHNKLWKILKEMGIPDHLTCLLRNLYVGQEATEPNMEQLTSSKLWKEGQSCILSPCLFNLYVEHIMQNAGLNHKLDSRLLGEISTTSHMQMIPF